ncbi:MAG TPA: 4a-hydroxytetrahydrobiopterin dehydratase [Blastocatellia bacterium]|nr:4a-hydroxytetrahydrobiopterin dehydratase [Blastocatellia bacterium]
MKRLTEEEIAGRLSRLEGWTKGENFIEKKYRFKSFVRAMLFVNAAGYVAESLDHHPDIYIHYNEVTLRNWTHVTGGLTERDFILAERIDAMAAGRESKPEGER